MEQGNKQSDNGLKAIAGSLIFQILEDNSIFGGDYDGRLGPLTDWINNNANLFQGKTVLDLGSNAGHFPIEYIRAGAKKVIAVEGRPEFFEQWKQFAPLVPLDLSMVDWWTADVRDFKLPGKVDIVSCLGLLYHVENFLPRLEELSAQSEMLLVEVQTGDINDSYFSLENPEDRTKSVKSENVLRASPDKWERLLYGQFEKNFHMSRIWLLTYGQVYRVKKQGNSGHEFALTLRAFYLLPRRGSDFVYAINDKTGYADITKQKVRVYLDESQP